MEWLRPRKPMYSQGYLIIESDDGNIGDFAYWLPLFDRIAQDYSDFYPQRCAVCCLTVNTATINTANKMTDAQLRTLNRTHFWEIMSHGKYHAGIGRHPVIVNASAGQNRIDVNGPLQLTLFSVTGYTYKVSEGVTEEIIQIASKTNETYTAGYITTVNPLQNSYTTAAVVQLTQESMVSELQSCIDELAAWDITATNHVFTYHGGLQFFFNQEAVDVVGQLFDSARGIIGIPNDYSVPEFDPHRLKATLLNDDLTTTAIDNELDDTLVGNKLMIIYGHGESSALRTSRLEHLIRGALNRGIRIITRKQAVSLLFN